MENNLESGITITEIIQMMWRNIILLLLITIFFTALGTVYVTKLQAPKYQSSGSIMVQVKPEKADDGSVSVVDSLRITNTIADLFRERVVLDAVRTELEEKGIAITNQQLRENVSVIPGSNSLFVYVAFIHKNAEIAQVITDVFLEIIVAQQNKYEVLKDTMKISSPAEPGIYHSPSKVKFILFSVIIGLTIGFIIVIIKELSRNVIRDVDDLHSITDLNVIGKISYVPEEDLNV